MLDYLFIRDFALIENLELAFAPGLTVVTGETGAGKSIMIDALACALGERADANAIRPNAARAEVSASFMLAHAPDARAWLKDHALDAEHECVVRRVVETDKGSKAFINGRPVPVQTLRELGELLVDIHGQHEHQSLLKRDVQRQLLDDYAGATSVTADVARYYDEVRALAERRTQAAERAAGREARLELLRHQARELDALDLKPGEIETIDAEHARQAAGAELLDGVQAAAHALYDDDERSVTRTLAQTTGRLEALARHDPKLAETTTLLAEAAIQITEAAARLHQYLDRLELDPQRLEWLDRRLAAIHDLARKHRTQPAELPALREHVRAELSAIEDADVTLAKLDDAMATARHAYQNAARELSALRVRGAQKLAREVTAQMQELGMPGGRFEAGLTPLPEGELSRHGQERVEFLVSANAGLPVKPLGRVASGGELSRVSLALQVVTARLGRVPTLIFDEVDVGVGGRVAEIVGLRLRALGDARQVLVITHLAQVAALGQQHLVATKRNEANGAAIAVYKLTDAERVQEIARMLGGVEIGATTVALASDMMSRADA